MMKQSEMSKLIKNQKNYINVCDQLLHNKGINKMERLGILKEIINNLDNVELVNSVSNEIAENLVKIIEDVLKLLPKSEISQQLFMHFGTKYIKKDLDQFYTPVTISSFINRLVYPNKSYIDPAAGTGDLLIEIDGKPTLWEISRPAIEMAELNYKMSYKDVEILETDSLEQEIREKYSYCVINPPFGSNTVTDDKDILKRYSLGKDRERQELGILFLELGLKLLEDGGILFAIVPGGYLGNSTTKYVREYLVENSRIISILKLPNGTFSRSGTGVSTYLIIVKKEKVIDKNYDIHISEIENIGYELSKKNTPVKFKIKENGEYVIENNKLVIDDDLIRLADEIRAFAEDKNVDGIRHGNSGEEIYDKCNIMEIVDNNYVMETGRYVKRYKDVLNVLNEYRTCKISDLCKNDNFGFKIDKDEMYRYVDIASVNTPLYKYKKIKGKDLPSRAKMLAIRDDIVISRLRGNISYAVILEDNVVVTNGMCILRAKDKTKMYRLLANIATEEFRVQHQAYTTGSIMESVSDEDILNIIVRKDIDHKKYLRIYNAIRTLHELL